MGLGYIFPPIICEWPGKMWKNEWKKRLSSLGYNATKEGYVCGACNFLI